MSTKSVGPQWLPTEAAREAFTLWAVCFGAMLVTFIPTQSAPFPLNAAAKLVATVGFLYLPELSMRRRGEDSRDYGLSLRSWRADLRLFAAVSAVVFPLFIAGFAAFTLAWDVLPTELLAQFTPYAARPAFEPRLPPDLAEWIIDDVFVVALPEEFFYRGFLQRRFRDAWPGGRLFLGARLGRAFWLTALLFAVGHLAIFQVWRVGVFFPALIFGWMRERSQSVISPALFHASANLLMKVLEASTFAR